MKFKITVGLFITLSVVLNAQSELKQFNTIMGKEQTKAMDAAVASFQTFLKLNYPDSTNLRSKTAGFLNDVTYMNPQIVQSWDFPPNTLDVYNQWESSGLRKEIWLWTNEDYEPQHFERPNTAMIGAVELKLLEEIDDDDIVPISGSNTDRPMQKIEKDSILSFNTWGKYLFALNQSCSSDASITEYTDVKALTSDISTALVASAFPYFDKKLDHPIIQRMIVAEFYYLFLELHLKYSAKTTR
ncbi:MAG: hypothetical protein N4A46_16395 [Schleiferiaceae bacterium]|nr:hypothetical protein [Schleiferiaceae bacterium]